MQKIIIFILGIQYGIGMFFRTTSNTTFGLLDLILHLFFVIQTTGLLYILYVYINGQNKDNMDKNTLSLVNTITNLIIFLAVLIISGNILKFVFIDEITNLF